MVNLRHRTKFHADRSNRCLDIAIYYFFQNGVVSHLGFVISTMGPPTQSTWWSLSIIVKNLL